ncbi:putative transcription regulator mTERF family [Medicago truncatula]|uniref:Putative transcription regulator mTERF family n=1 Tax=Medicago truncatula TaxID=3880 RepID=G7JKC7_MEDTR|nr:uncharacterized protein LOC11417325 [Medicago truncatula]AES91847.1 mTERF protein [Medicago truncatula]RHN64254.1 putative transcription regulator mTERF family [Medicago truncatula]
MLKFVSHSSLVRAQVKGFLLLFTTTSSSTLSSSSFNSNFNFRFSSASTTSHSFTVSYLINNYGLSPQTALNVSRKLTLSDTQKPDSVIALFTTHGFSNTQIRNIIKREPCLLLCLDPNKILLPKFQFLLSKGASTSDIVRIVNANPKFLLRSLHNHIIPTYDFIRGFLQSDKQAITCINRYASFISDSRVETNVKLLLDNGATHSNIATLLRSSPRIYCSSNLLETIQELKQLGFNSSTSTFSIALVAKRTVNDTRWAEKVEIFKKWGWSDEDILQAFRRQPYCMLSSAQKIDAVLSAWVDQLGLNSLDLVNAPGIFLLRLEKRVIPRAAVLQFLVSKGLRRRDASLSAPFAVTEKLFLDKFVKCFKEDSPHLLKLYQEKMNLANSMEKKPS